MQEKIVIYPPSREFRQTGGEPLPLRKRNAIVIEPGVLSNRLLLVSPRWFDARGIHFQWKGCEQEETVLASISHAPSIPDEGFRLVVTPRGVEITVSGDCGAFYALQTLRQLLDQSEDILPALVINDYPAFKRRGYMLDISRCKVPQQWMLKHLIELLSVYRYNELQLYTEHTFAYRGHEVVWADASALTPEAICELREYAAAHFIELVPNQNSFGHLERWFKHPEYAPLAECPEGFAYPWGERANHGFSLEPSDEAIAFLDGLYSQLLPNFTSELFNVGCDETWDLGQGKSARRCQEEGKSSVYVDFLCRIHKLVRRYGRRMMFWGDIILHDPEKIASLPDDMIGLVWGYDADTPFDRNTAHFARHQIPFYVCPGTSSWNSICGRLPNARVNIRNAAVHGQANGAMGILVTDWGDNG
ncbi:MAG: glycoside hydrolase, partial [Lentisphaerae bacterium]